MSITIPERIRLYVELHGSLRQAAEALGMDVGYLSRLASGEKANPGPEVLAKLRLRKVVTTTYEVLPLPAQATPLQLRTKSG